MQLPNFYRKPVNFLGLQKLYLSPDLHYSGTKKSNQRVEFFLGSLYILSMGVQNITSAHTRCQTSFLCSSSLFATTAAWAPELTSCVCENISLLSGDHILQDNLLVAHYRGIALVLRSVSTTYQFIEIQKSHAVNHGKLPIRRE